MRRKILVYVAGPFRAPTAWGIEQNIRRAEALALGVWREGYTAICPHTNTRHFQGELPDDIWLEGDLNILERCDAVILAHGWQSSTGTLREIERAQLLGIPVVHDPLEIEDAVNRVRAHASSPA